ncbi:MAG: hypothetical protein JWL64_908 [Frankiales bacterium]|nr:hypothetical protein [Frankiales bacterium]
MSTQTTPAPSAPAGRRKRGRESVGDMVRSLGLVLVIVLVAYWLAKPGGSDEQRVRVKDIGPSLSELQRQAPGVPVPHALPTGWRPTVNDGDAQSLRIGFLTPTGEYAEYAASLDSDPAFLSDLTGKGDRVGDFTVGPVVWQQYQAGPEHTTLVRVVDGRTVYVGGFRETTSLDELRTLAESVTS